MNGTNGKQSDFPDVALVPYPVIVAATKGDPDAPFRINPQQPRMFLDKESDAR